MTDLDGFPQLIVGKGTSPKQGGCLVQVCSYLYNGEWRDDTPCVHPVLRAAAIKVNDSVDDATRRKLMLLVPRLMDTAIDDEVQNKRVSVGLAVWSAEKVFHLVSPKDQPAARKAINAAKGWLDGTVSEQECDGAAASAAYAAAAAAADSADRHQFLIDLLDEYDRLTERTEPAPIPEEKWDELLKVWA